MRRKKYYILTAGLILIFILGGIETAYFISSLYKLPRIEQLENYQPSQITTVYAKDGEVIAEFFIERREIVSLSDIPDHLKNAFIAVEDHRFYRHPGVDIIRIVKAIWLNVVTWGKGPGASTITQQLARNLFLTQERTLIRKIREILLAIEIEKRYSKNEILEMYLNQIYFGHGVYGVAEAASFFFDKPLKKLSLAEAALLAGIPKSPGEYSPIYNPQKALRRRNYVLTRMYQVGFITKEEKEEAEKSPLNVTGERKVKERKYIYEAPYFVEWIRRIVTDKYGYDLLWHGGLKIYTTLDLKMQKAAEDALVSYLKKNDFQGALLAMDPHTGFIKAMVGGRDFEESQFNRATQARRQTGSAFKPFVYTAAIDSGKFSPTSVFFDGPVIFRGKKRYGKSGEVKQVGKYWFPENYEKHYWGKVYLWEMLAHSINVASVKLLQKVGVATAIKYARKMGIESPLNPDLTLTLGTSALTLLEMVRGYATIANYGVKVTPIFIQKIENSQGKVIEENFPKGESVLSPQTAFIMIDLLRKAVDMGTGSRIRKMGFTRPCAGKTGTVGWTGEKDTDKTMDAWFIGFTPDLVAGVWIGKDDGSPLGEKITGSVAAIPVWTEFMKKSLEGKPVEDFVSPPGIVFKKIDIQTGLLATKECKNAAWFAFLKDNAPQTYCFEHQNYRSLVKEFNPSRFLIFYF